MFKRVSEVSRGSHMPNVEQKVDARIQPMEPSDSELENVQDRSGVRKYWPQVLIVIFGLGLAAALFALQRAPVGGRSIVKITGVDPVYYFATAHSLLFDRDYDLTNDFQSLDPHQMFRTQAHPASGMPENPYAIGYPILSVPFLAAGTAVDALAGRPADGYSQSALYFYFLANIAFVVLGMIFLSRLLQHFGLSALQAIFLTFSLWLATTLGYYTLSPMSHSATFMMASAFMLVWWKVKDSSSPRRLGPVRTLRRLTLDLPLAGHLLPRNSGALRTLPQPDARALAQMVRVWRSSRALLDPTDRGVEGHLRQALHHSTGQGFSAFPTSIHAPRPFLHQSRVVYLDADYRAGRAGPFLWSSQIGRLLLAVPAGNFSGSGGDGIHAHQLA